MMTTRTPTTGNERGATLLVVMGMMTLFAIALLAIAPSVQYEVQREKEEKRGETVIRSERYYGTQYRSFTLQSDIDEGKADAKYENGVLELTLPKKEPATAKRVTIR